MVCINELKWLHSDKQYYSILFLYSSGVPAVVDFAAMREAVKGLGGDPAKINPLCPADLVIDHSVQVDVARRYHPSRHCVWSVCYS